MVGQLVTFPPHLFRVGRGGEGVLILLYLEWFYLSALRNIEEPAAKCTRAAMYNNVQL